MANSGEDFFARLPDCLLILIISFLPLKEAVRTSMLAKRWRQLWRFVPYMELDERHFTRLGAANQGNDQEEQLLQFFNFANTWIENYTNQTMDRFSLVFSRPHDYSEDMLCFIDFATRHGARNLELDFTGPAQGADVLPIRPENIPVPFDLPDCVHWFESFNLLKLSACVFNVTSFVNLGTLRSLYLGWVEITSTLIRQIMESCTVLESLSLVKCYGETQFMIMSSGLRRLVIDKCCDLLVLFVWTPNLRSFKYSGTVVEFGIVDFPELEEANVDLRLSPYFDDSNADRIASLLVHLRHAKTLSVCSYVTQLLATAADITSLPRRGNARHLIIKTALDPMEFRGIACLLNSYPQLEKLQLDIGEERIFSADNEDYGVRPLNFAPDTFWLSIEQPTCLKDTLKVVEINGFRGIANESYFSRFLNWHGRVLDTLKLRVDNPGQPPLAPIVQRLGNLNAVVELLEDKRVWEKLKEGGGIGDRMVFVGLNAPFALNASNFKDVRYEASDPCIGAFYDDPIGGYDVGV
ncbi:hypothetical protein Droror1_Dr00014821 [Drosera rotundifolia]